MTPGAVSGSPPRGKERYVRGEVFSAVLSESNLHPSPPKCPFSALRYRKTEMMMGGLANYCIVSGYVTVKRMLFSPTYQ